MIKDIKNKNDHPIIKNKYFRKRKVKVSRSSSSSEDDGFEINSKIKNKRKADYGESNVQKSSNTVDIEKLKFDAI